MKSLELFAGIGGISLAAEWAGIDTVAFCEREPYCQKVLNKHWPDVPIFDDVTTLDKSTLEERGVDVGAIELITGGFPCQPYSIAGKRQGTEDDRDLWPEMFRIIEEIRPRWVVGENVANFATMELDRTLFDLEPSVTKGAAVILPACAIGAPHRRDRTFIVAYAEQLGREEGAVIQKGDGYWRSHDQFNYGSEALANSDIREGDEWRGTGERYDVSPGEQRENIRGREKPNAIHNTWWATEPAVGRVAHGVPDRWTELEDLETQ
ncbi:LOW QUALITY PROTEIN: DNA-cytosine methyltransferase [Geomicrobium sp. JCM 19037]|nr:LOW QUALITY PROTEIN: DNA-cytosine methyltransferase [Geomicrobium sp. JCM 19037]